MIFLIIVFILILIIFGSFFWLYEVKYFVGRASVSQSSFSVDNSYLFISPLQATANGVEKMRATVFVLNNQGLGVMGKRVTLSPDPHLNIETIQGVTDSLGKAIFDISSSKAGEYYLEVRVEDKVLSQKLHAVFR